MSIDKMTNKEKYIRGIKELMNKRYLKGEFMTCPLCDVIKNIRLKAQSSSLYTNSPNYNSLCIGCPNYIFRRETYTIPCSESKTYPKWLRSLIPKDPGDTNPRYLFWKEALPILEALPPKAFTIRGYNDEYFKPLLEIDERIANEHNKKTNNEDKTS